MRDVRILVAELFGTMILVMGGPGSAILAGDRIHMAGVAFAFGLSLLIAEYTIGEKVLRLPPEPRVDKGIPFRDIPG